MAETVLTGLAYVFAVLTAIVLFILLLSLITRSAGAAAEKKRIRAEEKAREKREREEKKTGAPEPGGRTVLAAENDPERSADGTAGTDPKVVCAIMAAIDAFESERGRSRFRILSFRRVGRD